MSTQSNKKYILCLCFYRDKDGTLCLDETTEEGSISETMSMYVIGKQFRKSKLLDDADKNGFKGFCKAYLEDEL